jgi:hypothetical protein
MFKFSEESRSPLTRSAPALSLDGEGRQKKPFSIEGEGGPKGRMRGEMNKPEIPPVKYLLKRT